MHTTVELICDCSGPVLVRHEVTGTQARCLACNRVRSIGFADYYSLLHRPSQLEAELARLESVKGVA